MLSNINELLQRVEKVFGSSFAWNLGEYFILHEFDAWKDIADDIAASYDDCCCKTVLFEQLHIADITQKRSEYSRLKRCLSDPLPSECAIRTHNHNIDSNIAHIIQQMNEHFDGPIANIISQSFEYIVDKEQFEDLEAIHDDMGDIDNSVILMYIIEQIQIRMPTVSNTKSIVTEIQAIAMKNNAETRNRIEQSLIDVLLPLIKSKAKTKHEKPKHRKPKPKANYFDIMLFNFNVDVRDVVDSSTNDGSLSIGQTIDINNCKPIMLWLLNLYSIERWKELKEEYMLQYAFTANNWWQKNKYCAWIEKTNPYIAMHINGAIVELCKRALPPMMLDYRKAPLICDELGDFVGYSCVFHRMIHRVAKQTAPIQIDFWIIPHMTMTNGTNHRFKLHIEQALNTRHYRKDDDYFVMNVKNTSQLDRDMYHLLAKHKAWVEKQLHGNRYIFIIDRRTGKYPTIYLIGHKEDESEKDPNLPQSCLNLSKTDIVLNTETNKYITMRDSLDGYMFGLSYHVLSEDNIYLYWYHNGGGSKFELKDIKHRWPQWFQLNGNSRQQKLNDDIIQQIDNSDQLLTNVEFDEFKRQCDKIK
eukprot:232011_1